MEEEEEEEEDGQENSLDMDMDMDMDNRGVERNNNHQEQNNNTRNNRIIYNNENAPPQAAAAAAALRMMSNGIHVNHNQIEEGNVVDEHHNWLQGPNSRRLPRVGNDFQVGPLPPMPRTGEFMS